jgi:hypothetical protein
MNFIAIRRIWFLRKNFYVGCLIHAIGEILCLGIHLHSCLEKNSTTKLHARIPSFSICVKEILIQIPVDI